MIASTGRFFQVKNKCTLFFIEYYSLSDKPIGAVNEKLLNIQDR